MINFRDLDNLLGSTSVTVKNKKYTVVLRDLIPTILGKNIEVLPSSLDEFFDLFNDDELLPHCRDPETGFIYNDDSITIKSIEDVFGFDCYVYHYNNHEKNKQDLIKETEKDVLTDPKDMEQFEQTNKRHSFLKRDSSSVNDLRSAFMSCYDHFYKIVLSGRYTDNLDITQSWAVHTKPNDINKEQHPMRYHTHYMSPVCSVYYLQYEQGTGGLFSLENPMHRRYNDIMQFEMLSNIGVDSGCRMSKEIEIEEGDIVVFPGGIRHAITPYTGNQTRISIASNSIVSPIRSGENKYLFNVSGYEL